MNIQIIPYEERYRDDMIFMVLSAKNALGRVPRLNPDLLILSETRLYGIRAEIYEKRTALTGKCQ